MITDLRYPEFWIEQWRALRGSSEDQGKKGHLNPDYWDKWADDYDNISRENTTTEELIENIIDMLIKKGLFKKGMQILDVGCGTGKLALAFAQHGAQVTALDFSSKMLDRLKKSITEILPVEYKLYMTVGKLSI